MKRSPIAIVSIVLCLCFTLTACEFSFDPNGGEVVSKLTKLPTPNIVEIRDDYVYWEEVPNASSYVIQINDIQQSAGNSLKYSIASIMDNRIDADVPTELHIYVKAKGNQVLYGDSDWSSEATYTYTKKVASVIGKLYDEEAVKKAQDLRIGYAYNFIDDEYFDNNKASTNSILDLTQLFTNSSLSKQPSSATEAKKIYAESIKDFQMQISGNYSSKTSVGGNFDIFTASVAAGLSTSLNIDFKKYSKSGFLNCYSYAEFLNYQVLDYGNTYELSQMLSSGFSSLIKKEGIYSELSDDAVAAYILANYGTHLILGIKTGGRLDYYYSFATNNKDAALDFKTEITSSGSLDIAKIISASSEHKFGTEFSASISNNQTQNALWFKIYGGSTEGISESNIGDKFLSWSTSINEENARSIGVANDGIIYLPTLIEYVNPELARTLDEYITASATKTYDELISKFKTSEPSNDPDGTIEKPYEISTPAQLYQSLSANDNEGVHYKLTNDIDLKDFNWLPIENFKGVLDGNGYTISGLTVDTVGNLCDDENIFTGFIQVNEGTIKNVIFDKVNLNVKYTYDSKGTRYLYGGIVGCNKGTISNVQVINSGYILTNELERNEAGYDTIYPGVFLGAMVGKNAGNVEYCKVENTNLSGTCNALRNRCGTYSVVGGLVGSNDANIANCISRNVNINSLASGGCYVALKGGGEVFSYAGYIVGGNQNNVQNCISYNHTENSLTTQATKTAIYMNAFSYAGLACGNNNKTGTLDKVYVVSMDSVSNYVGNDSAAYKECIKTSVDEIAKIVNLWANWSYENGEFDINISK